MANKKKKFIWEQYALYATLLLMIAWGAVFAPKRMPAPEPEETRSVDAEQANVPPAETPAEANKQWVVTSCGQKERPTPLLMWPNAILKSHVAEYEKETSSYLERAKFKNGVSVVFIRELCPEPVTQFNFHFPEKRLVASLPADATKQYGHWVIDTIEDLKKSKAVSPHAGPLFTEIQDSLQKSDAAFALTPSQPEWGGVQITFRR